MAKWLRENDYGQIPVRLLANSTLLRLPFLAVSTPFTIKCYYLQIQRPRFRFVPKLVTLNDPERRNDRYFALFHRIW